MTDTDPRLALEMQRDDAEPNRAKPPLADERLSAAGLDYALAAALSGDDGEWTAQHIAEAFAAGARAAEQYHGINAAVQPSECMQSDDMAQWPQVVAYPGGAAPEGLLAWVDISTGDGPEHVHRYVRAASLPPVP